MNYERRPTMEAIQVLFYSGYTSRQYHVCTTNNRRSDPLIERFNTEVEAVRYAMDYASLNGNRHLDLTPEQQALASTF